MAATFASSEISPLLYIAYRIFSVN